MLREHQVEVEILREPLVELDALPVEGGALGRAVVRADDRRVAPRGTGADVRLLEDADVLDPVSLREVVRGREPVRAATDDDDVVAALELGCAAATSASGRRPPSCAGSVSSGTARRHRVQHRLRDVVAELLRDVDLEPPSPSRGTMRRHARERPAVGSRSRSRSVSRASSARPRRDPGEGARWRRRRGRPGPDALGHVRRIVLREGGSRAAVRANELLPAPRADEVEVAADLDDALGASGRALDAMTFRARSSLFPNAVSDTCLGTAQRRGDRAVGATRGGQELRSVTRIRSPPAS